MKVTIKIELKPGDFQLETTDNEIINYFLNDPPMLTDNAAWQIVRPPEDDPVSERPAGFLDRLKSSGRDDDDE